MDAYDQQTMTLERAIEIMRKDREELTIIRAQSEERSIQSAASVRRLEALAAEVAALKDMGPVRFPSLSMGFFAGCIVTYLIDRCG